MPQPVRFKDHPKAQPGAACTVCSATTDRPVIDHCHTHDWVRGVTCMSCNTLMSYIDRRFHPKIEARRVELLLSHAHRCPDCPRVTTADLTATSHVSRSVSVPRSPLWQAEDFPGLIEAAEQMGFTVTQRGRQAWVFKLGGMSTFTQEEPRFNSGWFSLVGVLEHAARAQPTSPR